MSIILQTELFFALLTTSLFLIGNDEDDIFSFPYNLNNNYNNNYDNSYVDIYNDRYNDRYNDNYNNDSNINDINYDNTERTYIEYFINYISIL
jgi:hypothetical protein